jgi:hypothetical protein
MYVGVVLGGHRACGLAAVRGAGQPKSRRNSGMRTRHPRADERRERIEFVNAGSGPVALNLSATYWRFVVGDGQLGRRME